MNSTFVLILMSAGVLVAILGAILVASERELKAKRRQIEELLTRLENSGQGSAMQAPTDPQPDHSAELAELRAQNRDLQNQLQALSGKLELSQRTIDELKATRESDQADPPDTARLRAANDQLQAQLEELRDRLAASEARIDSAPPQNQDSQDRYAGLQAEVVELRQEIEARGGKIHELEAAQQNIPDIDAIEARYRQERQGLEERIAELERRLLSDQEMLTEAQTLRQHIAEAEESQKSLREEIRRHEEEIPRWQARIAEGQENRQRLAALRAPFDAVLSKQATLAEQQRQLQEDLSAFARLMAIPNDTTPKVNSTPGSANPETQNTDPAASEPTTRPVVSAGLPNLLDREAENQTAQESSAPQSAAHEPIAATDQPKPKRARSYGIFGLLILLAATGAAAFQFLGSKAAQAPATPGTMSAAKTASQTESIASEPQPAPPDVAPAFDAPTVKQAMAKPGVNENLKTISRARQSAKPQPRVAGTFQVTRPSRVYAAPSESSRSIGDIEPGVKVIVVDSRGGWLEIHSKHGRPPGFIRREVAARVSGQN